MNKFKVTYKFKAYENAPYLGVSKVKTKIVHAGSPTVAEEKFWEVVPKLFNPGGFEYGLNHILDIQKIQL